MSTPPDPPDQGRPPRPKAAQPGRGGGAGRGRDDRPARSSGARGARRDATPRPGAGSSGGASASWRAPGRRAGEEPERPFRPPRKPAPRKPQLPDDRPVVPREAWRDLRATVPPNVLDDVVKAVSAAAEAVEVGDDARAIQLLTWAKSVAPRTATIREALGIAHYAAERFSDAHSELLAYRRLSGAQDQNHVLADCARAAGRQDKVREYVEQMIAARVDAERVAEGLMVLAGDRADHGDLEGAMETLQRAGLDPVRVHPFHARLWYLAGDLSQRLGRRDDAREFFEAILAVDEEFGDVEERLAALDDSGS